MKIYLSELEAQFYRLSNREADRLEDERLKALGRVREFETAAASLKANVGQQTELLALREKVPAGTALRLTVDGMALESVESVEPAAGPVLVPPVAAMQHPEATAEAPELVNGAAHGN